MSQFVFKMPDLGEGTVEAEIVAWHTEPGALVTEDQVIVEVMTDKAAVEVPAPVSGRVLSITGAPGDKIAVGSPLIVFETEAPRAPDSGRGRRIRRARAARRRAAVPAARRRLPRASVAAPARASRATARARVGSWPLQPIGGVHGRPASTWGKLRVRVPAGASCAAICLRRAPSAIKRGERPRHGSRPSAPGSDAGEPCGGVGAVRGRRRFRCLGRRGIGRR